MNAEHVKSFADTCMAIGCMHDHLEKLIMCCNESESHLKDIISNDAFTSLINVLEKTDTLIETNSQKWFNDNLDNLTK